MPGAGGVVLANYLYNVAPKDGSAIALLQGGTPLEPLFGFSQAKYDVTKFNWLVSLNRLVSIGVFWHTSPARTADDLFTRDVLVGSSGGGDSSTEITAAPAQSLRRHAVQDHLRLQGHRRRHARHGARRGRRHRRP